MVSASLCAGRVPQQAPTQALNHTPTPRANTRTKAVSLLHKVRVHLGRLLLCWALVRVSLKV